MSQQGPIIIVSDAGRPAFGQALDDANLSQLMDATWAEASRAVERLEPAAVLIASSDTVEPRLDGLARQIAAKTPYLPLIAVDPRTSLPENALPFAHKEDNSDRLVARLRAALRVRTL